MSLGKRIKSARARRGLSQQQLADILGVTSQAISQFENDKSMPSYDRLEALRSALGPEIMEGEEAGRADDHFAPRIIPGRQLVSPEMMPVYAAAAGGDGHVIVTIDPIDHVKRPAVLENVRGGYGLLLTGESMVPVFRPGDIALVHPHLPPRRESEVVLYGREPERGDVAAMVKQLDGWTDTEWRLRQWNPARQFKLSRGEWPVCHRVVGKYAGR